MAPRGLVLVVGSTSSRQVDDAGLDDRPPSTTTSGHVLAIEDPIEYLHRHEVDRQPARGRPGHARLPQRAQERDAQGAGRDPDRRDPRRRDDGAASPSPKPATCALATLHSNNADPDHRAHLNFFPGRAQNVLMNLALNLRAVISQRLVIGFRQPPPGGDEVLKHPHIPTCCAAAGARGQAGDPSLGRAWRASTGACTGAKTGRVERERARRRRFARGPALKFRLSKRQRRHDPYADVFDTSSHGPSSAH